MDKRIDDGGQVYPASMVLDCNGRIHYGYDGMNLRDHFASQAIGASCEYAFNNPDICSAMSLLPEEWVARISYGIADAMLAARSAKT